MKEDIDFLKRAVKIAGEGIVKGFGPFGAVIVKDDKILSEAGNSVVKSHDPTAHAEIQAIRMASDNLKSHDLAGCVLYASCEPCPMCLGAIYWAGIKKVVYASDRYDAEEAGFGDNMIYKEIMLDPSERNLEFIRLEAADGNSVFKKWMSTDDKICY